MPQPNNFQSPPHPRYHPSQGSITGLPSEPRPMRNPASFFTNASVRHISSRRARPVATSIADVFVCSLVMAGYCHEHTPRGRSLSTVSTKVSGGITRNWDRRGERSSRRIPAKSPSGSLSQIGSLGVSRTRTQRMLNSSVAQWVEEQGLGDQRIQQTSAYRPSGRASVDYSNLKRWNRLKEHPKPSQIRDSEPGRSDDNTEPDEESERVEGAGMRDGVEEEPGPLDDYENNKSHGKRLYKHTYNIYKELLKGSINWKEAADAAAAFTPYPPRRDTTKSAVDISSVQLLDEKILDKSKKNHYIFELYRSLPSPGVRYLSKRTRGALLRRFARPPDRRWVDARRYLALVDDMLAARLPMAKSLWTSAIYLAGRSQREVVEQDLIRAIGVWNQMEHLAKVESDSVVFTVLFDIAVKAGQYTVADRLLEEMDRRNLRFGRAGKVALIFYYGLKKETEGVRRSFEDFVQSGELVDTAVMNCVLASLLRCGERALAEELYHRLLQTRSTSDISKTNLTSEFTVYRKATKNLGRVLQLSASLKTSLPRHHAALQKALEIGPDTRTFHVLLSYHAQVTGNLNAIKHVLRDMEKFYLVPPRGMIYLILFQGFAEHGEQVHNRWNAKKLRKVWEAYVTVLYECQTRLQREEYDLPPGFVWENPLGGSGIAENDDGSPSDFILDQGAYTAYERNNPLHDAISAIFGVRPIQRPPYEFQSPEALEHRLENGVFLGRRMIMIILRAFGSLCEPDEILDVYFHMMEIWQPRKRRVLDVQAVREELEVQLKRAEMRLKDGL
ncbi:hypothetical protein BDV18DRAFT_133765 [Aspergillus unguis]